MFLTFIVGSCYSPTAMFAVIKTGGKQYKVSTGSKIKVEKLEGEVGSKVSFSEVLLSADKSEVQIGAPLVKGVEVVGVISKIGRNRKVIGLKYHSKTRYHRKKGHRQHFTEVEIKNIG